METNNIIARQQAEIDATNIKLIAAEGEIARLTSVIESRHAVVGALMGDVARAEMGGEVDVRSAALEVPNSDDFDIRTGVLAANLEHPASDGSIGYTQIRAALAAILTANSHLIATPPAKVQGAATEQQHADMILALIGSGYIDWSSKRDANDEPFSSDAHERAHLISLIREAAAPSVAAPVEATFDFHSHLARQAAFSLKTFGPGARTAGVCDHIRKELLEIEADPLDLKEWVDVVILALDGAWRCGGSPDQIISGIVTKQTKNEGRIWPDWRTADPTKAIEHDRSSEVAPLPAPSKAAEGSIDPNVFFDALADYNDSPMGVSEGQAFFDKLDGAARKAAIGASEWISVNDRLPKSPMPVLAAYHSDDDGEPCLDVCEAMFYPNGEWIGAGVFYAIGNPLKYEMRATKKKVTHWMPKPEAPTLAAQVSDQPGAADSAGGDRG